MRWDLLLPSEAPVAVTVPGAPLQPAYGLANQFIELVFEATN